MLRNKRLGIALLIAAVIAAAFWSQSRVPALNEKAQMGVRTNFGSIAFDIVLPVSADQPIVERVLKSSVNWGYTNWKGMTFGLLFAAAALTILGFVRRRSFANSWLNTLTGMFVGAPLGVCVNCATPIAQGMYAAGARLETALATLVSSPMLNAIVLSMAFTLLPWEMALSSVIGVVLLLIAIPFLVRWFPAQPGSAASDPDIRSGFAGVALPAAPTPAPDNESLPAAVGTTLTAFIRNLFYMLKIALPLMLVAGFLGALVIELIPFNLFVGFKAGFLVLAGTAVFATLLPVPMAFNVIVVMALLANGMPPGLGAVLLFALSVYSIYPASVIARYISIPLSIALATAVIVLATGIGLTTDRYFDLKQTSEELAIEQGLALGRQEAYQDAINVCEQLPGSLQLRCFADHIGDFDDVIAYDEMCTTRPSAVGLASCQLAVETYVAQQDAVASSSSAPCEKLTEPTATLQCTFFLAFSTAVAEHDISMCNQLTDSRLILACRSQFLNSSLLFSPDDSVCENLAGQELSDCTINATIYRYVTTQDFEGCGNLPTRDSQEHCRYTMASSMIGQSNDSSGCVQLRSPARRRRCESLVTAWQAEREDSFDLCRQLPATDLQHLCLSKIANRRIATILVNYTLQPPAEPAQTITGTRNGAATPYPAPITAPDHRWQIVLENNRLEIAYTPYQTHSTDDRQMFTRIQGQNFGITKSWEFGMNDFFEPFMMGKGIASGDFNNDLWPDLVLATEQGVVFYQNTGGKFQLLEVPQGELRQKNVFLVALVDADNDGWSDLFASTYGAGNFLLLNRNGDFSSAELIRLDGDQRLTLAAGFADLDQSGTLDIVLGNWSSGAEKSFSPEESANRILFRRDNSYIAKSLEEVKGETLTVLLADINGDQKTDLLIGNDRLVPDAYYLGAGDGSFEPITRSQERVPVTSMFTMSLEAADFNNDLRPDLFSTDMTFARSSEKHYCDAIDDVNEKSRCTRIIDAYALFTKGNATNCSTLGSPRQRKNCFSVFSVKAAKEQKEIRYCNNLTDTSSSLYSLCRYLSSSALAGQPINQDRYIRQVQRNVLLINGGEQFVEKAQTLGIDKSFWSWNAKAADLDNDGWQDIYVGNGFHFGDSFYEIQKNILFRNIDGEKFEQVGSLWGLDDPINTPSYTYLDIDLDGDMDIVATGVLAPPRVFLNQQQENNSITFKLDDKVGNSDGIGAKITIRYGGDENIQQRKENKLSGGFLSFDNPLLHFGVGTAKSIDGFTLRWPNGQVERYEAELPVNRIYRITRKEY